MLNFDDVEQSDGTFTRVILGEDAKQLVLEGMKIAHDAVCVTLGPKGKCVLIQRQGKPPVSTKDGVTVSKAINLKNQAHAAGAMLVREAASRTNDVAGDGTTTSTALAYAFAVEGKKYLSKEFAPITIRRGIESVLDHALVMLDDQKLDVNSEDELKWVATISANGDEKIGKLVAKAVSLVGKDGVAVVEEAKGTETELVHTEGLILEKGFASPYFITNAEKQHASYDDCTVVMFDKKINTFDEIVPYLEHVYSQQKPVLIIAEDYDQTIIQALVVNRSQGSLKVVAIRSPGVGFIRTEILKDVSSVVGGNVVQSGTEKPSQKEAAKFFGVCKRVVVDKSSTLIVGLDTSKDSVAKRCAELDEQLCDPTLSQAEVDQLRVRRTRLSTGAVVVKVGGMTEVEVVERKHRIEDALNATKAAAESGVLPGGGKALFNVSYALRNSFVPSNQEEEVGLKIMAAVCEYPMKKILANAEKSYDVVSEKLVESKKGAWFGYDVTKDSYCDLREVGLLDPYKVTKHALLNAASVAINFITLDALIIPDVGQ